MSDTTSPAEPAVSTAAPPERHPFSWLPYAQLVRLPNVFTAMADIAMTALVAGALPAHTAAVLLVLLASCCLYCAGMVWNDYFDLEQDKRERPFRPLPSGRISPQAAARLGAALLAAGVGLAALAGLVSGEFRAAPLTVAVVLAFAILLYDGLLKRTVLGPVGMGACRFLNVLLGLSVVPDALGPGVLLAAVVGTYIAGVTWFARTEAVRSRPGNLTGAAVVMLAGLLLALAVPVAFRPAPRGDTASPLVFVQVALGQILFPYLLVAFGFYAGAAVLRAVARPDPERVQAAVKRAVLGLVLLDALLATAVVGTAGLLLALLLLPASYLGRQIYST
jgi:4-hydroxybenzoate polyprenyltransferase